MADLPASLRPIADQAWSPPAWLDRWRPSDPAPVGAEEITRAIIAVERALEPADQESILLGLDQIWWLHHPPKNDAADQALRHWWAANRTLYLAAMADLPIDLARLALRRVGLHCRFEPKPDDFRRAVEDEMSSRRSAAKLLAHVAWRLSIEKPRAALPPIDPDYARARIAEVTRRLTSASAGTPGAIVADVAEEQLSLGL